MNPWRNRSGSESTRMDAFTDGTFSIVATLLVLEVKLPAIPEPHTQAQLVQSLLQVVPSLVAFAFSFLTIMIYWLNHEQVARLLARSDMRSKCLNLLLLFFICLIPFVTRFIAEYPRERVAVAAYGVVMLGCGVVANLLFRYVAFGGSLMKEGVSPDVLRRYALRAMGGPILYAAAIPASLLSVRISIGLYLAIPLLYVVLPKVELHDAA